jgi:hypothetical protein
MKFRSKLWALCLAAFSTGSALAATLSGTLTNDTTLSGTNVFQGTVVVANGVVLTLNPGARVLMSTGAMLVVQGQLLALGTSNAPIYFTREVAGQRWKQIKFMAATNSVLRHCFIEFANSAGTHLDYYDNDCNTNTVPPARNYHEAVVALATRLEIEACTFRYLPDSSAGGEGDALAIVSDDPQTPGAASARIANCQFLDIGQGIHTRYSHVLVENCFFTSHNGDNDDVDMYGESSPPPLIRNNVFLNPSHDDIINPTRCSAVIMGNVMSGGDDHGIVLRDKCAPIVINNVISSFASAGIAVQNQCDALIANNTIVDCGRGIRFFDHDQRWGPPYCLFPGSGRATIINCIIWDCPTSFLLADSPYTQDRGSHAQVLFCNVEGGQATASVGPNSTLTWGAGNINSDPQFINLAANDYHLRTNSACIDAGTNVAAALTNFSMAITNDLDDLPRPLDGNGDGLARFDIGAYEILLDSADSNGDGIPDGWTWMHRLNPTDPNLAADNPDGDAHTTFEEWVADTDPVNPLSSFRIEAIRANSSVTLQFFSSSNRQYSLTYTTNLAFDSVWENVPSQVDVAGSGGLDSLADTNGAAEKFYRVRVKVP